MANEDDPRKFKIGFTRAEKVLKQIEDKKNK